MEILRFEESPRKSGLRITKSRGLIAVLGVFAFAALGTTLAGSITLNAGQNIEFGQAVARTASCDTVGGITIAPTAKFANAGGANGTGTFNLGTITVSGIDDTCIGKVFTIEAYDNTANSSPLNIVSVSTTPYYKASFTAGTTPAASGGVNAVWSGGSPSSNSMAVGFSGTTIDAASVQKLTIESSN